MKCGAFSPISAYMVVIAFSARGLSAGFVHVPILNHSACQPLRSISWSGVSFSIFLVNNISDSLGRILPLNADNIIPLR